MLLRIVLLIAILLAAVMLAAILVLAAAKPAELHIQRSIVINAAPEKVFAFINDLHSWKDWNADEKEDSTVARSFSGSLAGVGAVCDWDSRGKAGKGTMTITGSEFSRRVVVTVDFVKPFQTHNVNEFRLEQEGASTRLTWSWEGQNLYFMKAMGVFVNMDKMIGQHFESGLANLKSLAEK